MCEPVRQCDLVLHPLRMRIEQWELSIGQIPRSDSGQRILPSYFCASPKLPSAEAQLRRGIFVAQQNSANNSTNR